MTIFAQEEQEQEVDNKTQIVIGNTGAIKDFTWYGDYQPPDKIYTNYYNPVNAFDNQINDKSFFAQNGPSGFKVNLKEEIKDPICSAELNVKNPNNAPFNLTLGDITFKGKTMNESVIPFATKFNDKSIEDVDSISMNFATPIETWTLVSELKLFSDDDVNPPPLECDEGYHLENGVCVKDGTPPPITPNNGTNVFNISDSNTTLAIKNSTVTLDIDRIIIEIENDTNITDSYSNISKPVSSIKIEGASN